MNQEQFIAIIKLLVEESAIEGLHSSWSTPPGRKPSENLLKISEWYTTLDDHTKQIVQLAVQDTLHYSIFSLLAILDGVRKSTEDGHFELFYVSGETRSLLNDPNDNSLHDIYNSTQ